jgi:hypothetical protein
LGCLKTPTKKNEGKKQRKRIDWDGSTKEKRQHIQRVRKC